MTQKMKYGWMLDVASTSQRLAKDVGTPEKVWNLEVLFIFCAKGIPTSAHY